MKKPDNRMAVVKGRQAEAPEPVRPPPAALVEKISSMEKIACPYCGKRKSSVQRTIGSVRYRRCDGGCGRAFRTVEVMP